MRRSRTSAAIGVIAAIAAIGMTSCGGPVARATAVASCGGDVVIAGQADVARLTGCRSLHDVVIRSGGALELSRLGVETITGDLRIGPTVGVEDVTLAALREVRGELRVVGNGMMQGLFARQLEHAGAIAIDGNAALTTIALPALRDAAGLRVTDNASLELLDLAGLARVDGALVVTGAARLTLLDAPQLHAAGRVELDAPRVPAEIAAALRRGVAPSP